MGVLKMYVRTTSACMHRAVRLFTIRVKLILIVVAGFLFLLKGFCFVSRKVFDRAGELRRAARKLKTALLLSSSTSSR